MEPHERNWVRLPLEGAYNVRELGGYPTANGGQTKYHRFLRADGLSYLSERDVRFLHDYGVRAVLDLRDENEVEDAPDISLGRDVVYANIPLLAYNAADLERLEDEFGQGSFTLANLYHEMMENYEGIRACLRFIAAAPTGCVLFHCAVGKDRTGVLASLLLGLAGVDKWDIVANYEQSWANLMRDEVFSSDWRDSARSSFREGMLADPTVMAGLWDVLEAEHGGVGGLLLECGVSDEEVSVVRRRLIEG